MRFKDFVLCEEGAFVFSFLFLFFSDKMAGEIQYATDDEAFIAVKRNGRNLRNVPMECRSVTRAMSRSCETDRLGVGACAKCLEG